MRTAPGQPRVFSIGSSPVTVDRMQAQRPLDRFAINSIAHTDVRSKKSAPTICSPRCRIFCHLSSQPWGGVRLIKRIQSFNRQELLRQVLTTNIGLKGRQHCIFTLPIFLPSPLINSSDTFLFFATTSTATRVSCLNWTANN
jgi:hypothetical protein